jgi:hypothetical protein
MGGDLYGFVLGEGGEVGLWTLLFAVVYIISHLSIVATAHSTCMVVMSL